ncbi:hypothetical protein HAALTHF_30700n [Vreelandella aquamarina]|nr:hypothetical protein HAALTHF_30700n [Halomonas axialensis]
MAALGGAVAFTEGDNTALAIAKQLYFQMAGTCDIGFQEDTAITKVALAKAFH